ncbi:transglutaminase [Crocinitomix sp.]|nr:transglutaminase [Crocinitomix sp.]
MEDQKESKNRGGSVILLGIVSAVLTMPLFILLYKYFPSIAIGDFRLDHILLFLTIFFVTYYLLKKLRLLVYIILIAGLVVLTITNFSGMCTVDNLYHDYAELLYDLSENSLQQKFNKQQTLFKKEKELREAIDYRDPIVRNYATSAAIKNFEEDAHLSKNRKWVQFFSVFKEVYSNWKYVYDPIEGDYYAKASETVEQLKDDGSFKGDCDDYSIMMGAAIKAIGGEVRLIRTVVLQNEREVGHMYPEVKIGDEKDLEFVVYLIKNVFFVEESKGKSIYYYEDNRGFIWLNFDYNDNYPGGKYMSEIRESEIVI